MEPAVLCSLNKVDPPRLEKSEVEKARSCMLRQDEIDSESYVTRKEFKQLQQSFFAFLDGLETPPDTGSTMHLARSMSVGQRMAIIGQLANPNRATRPFFCIPPPPKKLHHSKGLTPKCGKFGHPLAKDLS